MRQIQDQETSLAVRKGIGYRTVVKCSTTGNGS
jgi:hypothetical protein